MKFQSQKIELKIIWIITFDLFNSIKVIIANLNDFELQLIIFCNIQSQLANLNDCESKFMFFGEFHIFIVQMPIKQLNSLLNCKPVFKFLIINLKPGVIPTFTISGG